MVQESLVALAAEEAIVVAGLAAALLVATEEAIAAASAVVAIVAANMIVLKCIKQFAAIVVAVAKFHSARTEPSRYSAALVSERKKVATADRSVVDAKAPSKLRHVKCLRQLARIAE